jgi:hypothetical protein
MSCCIVPKDCREIGQDLVYREIFRMSGLVEIVKNVILNFHLLLFCTIEKLTAPVTRY